MLRSRSARADESVRKMAGRDLKVNTVISMKEIYIYYIIGLRISIDFIWLLYDIFDLSVCVYMYVYVPLLLRSFYII